MSASSISPLLDAATNEKSGSCNKLRKIGLICQPIVLLAILTVCVIAYVYPFWDNNTTQSMTNSHPFITTEQHPALLHANIKQKYLTAQALSDLVTGLPGLDEEVTLNYNHYSGYVDALDGRQLHYWFFEAQEKPETAPLFFWTNGIFIDYLNI